MTPLNLPTPAPEDGPVDYAAHVLRTLKGHLDLAAMERQTHDPDTVFTGWHTSRDSYVCYFLHPRFLHARALGDLQERTNLLARAYAGATADFPVLTGLVVPGATETAARLYQRLFDLPLLTIPMPSAFIPMNYEVMP